MDNQELQQLRDELTSMYKWMARVKFVNSEDEIKAARFSKSLLKAIENLPE